MYMYALTPASPGVTVTIGVGDCAIDVAVCGVFGKNFLEDAKDSGAINMQVRAYGAVARMKQDYLFAVVQWITWSFVA